MKLIPTNEIACTLKQRQDAFGCGHGMACSQEEFLAGLIIIPLCYLELEKRNISTNSASYRKLQGASFILIFPRSGNEKLFLFEIAPCWILGSRLYL